MEKKTPLEQALDILYGKSHGHAGNAMNVVKRQAEKGVALAQWKYGTFLRSGFGMKANVVRGTSFIEKAAEQGLDGARNELGIIYLGSGQQQKGVECLRLAAENGFADAQQNYSICLMNGIGIEKDEALGLEYCQKAAEQGNLDAMNTYAACIVETDAHRALKYWLQCAAAGHTEAQRNCAKAMWDGIDGKENKKVAIMMWKKAADAGNAAAQNDYAVRLAIGDNVDKDPVMAVKYFKMAIDSGNTSAMHNLASHFWSGTHMQQDKQQAIKLWRMAADQGLAESQNEYAVKLMCGDGVECDPKSAVAYWMKAAQQGLVMAQDNVADFLYDGQFIEQDKELAIKYMKTAAEHEMTRSLNHYGYLLAYGIDVEKDEEKGHEYLEKCAAKGDLAGKNSLALFLWDRGSDEDKQRALELWKEAAAAGLMAAQDNYDARVAEI